MKDGQEIPIRLLSGPSRTWLSLSGTILTYRERVWGRESQIDVPHELIAISETKRTVGTRLIFALLALFFGPAIGGAIIGLSYLFLNDVHPGLVAILIGGGFIAGMAVFIIYLVRFFSQETSVHVDILPNGGCLEFWLCGDYHSDLSQLLAQVRSRGDAVREMISHPLRSAVGDEMENPWKTMIVATFLCAFPAFLTEIKWLLLLCVIPPLWHTCKVLASFRQPARFRQAMRSYLKGRLPEALAELEVLVQTSPTYLPAQLMKLGILARLGQFDAAADVLSCVQGDVDVDTLQSIQEELVLRRRIWERKHVAVDRG